MPGIDPIRLSRTLAYLLRYGHASQGLAPAEDGWFPVEEVAVATSRAMQRPVSAEDVLHAATHHGGQRFDLRDRRIRASAAAPEAHGPDILYHAVPRSRVDAYRAHGVVASPHGGPVHLSRAEGHAWWVAWRQFDDPTVLFVDAARARRDGLRFGRSRSGQFYANRIPTRHVLNLRDGFAEQASAGGFLVDWSRGRPRIALIRVSRRHGTTWEVAKGKLEAGEAPERAAVREVCEEMGVTVPVRVSRSLGTVRYGFSTPEGHPRLKTIYLYVLEVDSTPGDFRPAAAEGIDQVRWFDLYEAVDVLAHPSLRGAIGRLLSALDERAGELGLRMVG